jgi:hypothetical protein
MLEKNCDYHLFYTLVDKKIIWNYDKNCKFFSFNLCDKIKLFSRIFFLIFVFCRVLIWGGGKQLNFPSPLKNF